MDSEHDSHDSALEEEEAPANLNNIYFHKGFEKVVLCLFWRSGKLGAAAYYLETEEIQLLNDIADVRPHYQICQHLIREIRPTTVLTSKTLSTIFLERIQEIINYFNTASEDNTAETTIQLNTIASKHFQYKHCKTVVSKITILERTDKLLDKQRWCYLQTLINFDCKMMISALGGLLFFLDTFVSKIVLQIPSLHVRAIRALSLDSLVYIDGESYKALEIFSSTPVYASGGLNKWSREKSKDSLCIHSIFNRCNSAIGSQYMRILLCHPIKDIVQLQKRHEVIDFFLKLENQVTLQHMKDCLKNIRNTSSIIQLIVGTQANATQWKIFYKTVHNIVAISEICRANPEIRIFKDISESMDKSLRTMSELIEMCMDFEASERSGRFTVKKGAQPELDELKERFKDMPKVMETVASEELKNLPQEIDSCSLVYLPEVGYLLAIPAWKQHISESDLKLRNMSFKFVLNNVFHFKTAACAAMDNELGDSHLLILQHEMEIMHQIVQFIADHYHHIIDILDEIKLLDCLIAFASVAQEYDMVKPNLVNKQVVDIEKGSHLLIQKCVKSFIPNDFKSSINDSLIKIFTGPNSSGKSVYLKQIALIVYMAHIGSFVPAKKATIGVVDYIHTRIKTTESVATELSSFSLDLRQMYSSVYNSSPNTLIVVDEFGKGTTDVDGLSLLYGFINNFMERKENSPHVLISTHFQAITSLLPKSPLLKFQTLEFMLENDSIVYLYKVKDGFISNSFAHLAAATVGVSKRIIDRADEILQIILTDDKEPKVQTQNKRAILMKRRRCVLNKLDEECRKKKERFLEIDLQEVVKLLNSVRLK